MPEPARNGDSARVDVSGRQGSMRGVNWGQRTGRCLVKTWRKLLLNSVQLSQTRASSISSWTPVCAWRREFTLSAASRSVASSNTAGWRSCGTSRTVTTASHCSRIFSAASQPMMGGMSCYFISAAASAYEIIMLASNVVSHHRVTIKASEPAERERSVNWKMLTVSFTQSGSSVKSGVLGGGLPLRG